MNLFSLLFGDFFDQERRHEKDKKPSVFAKKCDSLTGRAKHKASDRANQAGEDGAYLLPNSFKPSPTFLPTVFIPFAAALAPFASILAKTQIVIPTAVTTVARVKPCLLKSSFSRSRRDLKIASPARKGAAFPQFFLSHFQARLISSISSSFSSIISVKRGPRISLWAFIFKTSGLIVFLAV